MLFMVAAYLKPGFEQELLRFSDDLNEHFAQSVLVLGGALHDAEGRRRGYLGFVEGESLDDATQYVHQGPFYERQLYERIDIFRYEVEVGRLG